MDLPSILIEAIKTQGIAGLLLLYIFWDRHLQGKERAEQMARDDRRDEAQNTRWALMREMFKEATELARKDK